MDNYSSFMNIMETVVKGSDGRHHWYWRLNSTARRVLDWQPEMWCLPNHATTEFHKAAASYLSVKTVDGGSRLCPQHYQKMRKSSNVKEALTETIHWK